MNTSSNNPLSIPLNSLLQRLTLLNGFQGLIDNQLENFRKTFKHRLDEQDIDPSNIFAGYAFVLSDLTVSFPQTQKYKEYFHAGLFTKEGEDYFLAADELISKWSAWTVSQCFEAFETYLRDINGYFYWHLQPSKPIFKLTSIPFERENVEAWKNHFRSNQWNSATLLKQLRVSAPSLKMFEEKNSSQINLLHWHKLFTTVRHAITHSNMKLNKRKLDVPNDAIEQLLPNAFPGTWENDVYHLNLSKEHAKETITTTGEYSLLIFKCLCKSVNLNWEVLQRL